MREQSIIKKGVILLPVLLCSLIVTAQWNTSGNDINNTNSGNVGIGTSTPATKLHVDGKLKVTGANTGQIEFTGNNPYNPGFVFDGSLSKTSMYVVTSQNFSTSTGGGTLFNGSYIQVYNNAEVRAYQQPFTIKKYYPGVGATSGLIIDNDQSGTLPSASAYNILSAKFSGTEVANIKGDGSGYFAGKVGIGTTSPAYKLHVEGETILNDKVRIATTNFPSTGNYKLAVGGDIIAEKVRVRLQSSGWPDYVFSPQYPLLPLKQVEEFININKHLPDVPAALQIEQEGLDLGDGQAMLLKKIEELTLYIIDLNKRMEQLEKENLKLKKVPAAASIPGS